MVNIEEVFLLIDTANAGYITKDQFCKAFRESVPTDLECEEIFRSIDKNGNGKISLRDLQNELDSSSSNVSLEEMVEVYGSEFKGLPESNQHEIMRWYRVDRDSTFDSLVRSLITLSKRLTEQDIQFENAFKKEKRAMNNQLEDAQLQYDKLIQELRKTQSQAQKEREENRAIRQKLEAAVIRYNATLRIKDDKEIEMERLKRELEETTRKLKEKEERENILENRINHFTTIESLRREEENYLRRDLDERKKDIKAMQRRLDHQVEENKSLQSEKQQLEETTKRLIGRNEESPSTSFSDEELHSGTSFESIESEFNLQIDETANQYLESVKDTSNECEEIVLEAAGNPQATGIDTRYNGLEVRQRNLLRQVGDDLNQQQANASKKAKQVYDQKKKDPGMAQKTKRAFLAVISAIKESAQSMFFGLISITKNMFFGMINIINQFVTNHWRALLLGLVTGSITAIAAWAFGAVAAPIAVGAGVVGAGTVAVGALCGI